MVFRAKKTVGQEVGSQVHDACKLIQFAWADAPCAEAVAADRGGASDVIR